MPKTLLFTMLFISSMPLLSQLPQVDSLKVQEVEEVQVSANFGEVVFEDDQQYVIDFYISEDVKLLLLKRFRKYHILSLNDHLQVEDTLLLEFRPQLLYEDCFGNVYVFSKDSMHTVVIQEGQIMLLDALSRDAYSTFYKHCLGSVDNYFYTVDNRDFMQTQVFSVTDQNSMTSREFYRISDSSNFRTARETYYETEAQRGTEVRQMQEIGISELIVVRRKWDNVQFYDQQLSRAMYNPLFVRNDTLVLFDHLQGEVKVFDQSLQLVESHPIDYHQSVFWDKIVAFDPVKGRFYSGELELGTARYIRLKPVTYAQGRQSAISETRYPEKVIIHNGFAYYTYSPELDVSVNKLYRQRL